MNAVKRKTLLDLDPYLSPYFGIIQKRISDFKESIKNINQYHKDIYSFANLHKFLGFHLNDNKTQVTYREWAPCAEKLSLIGDFNNWDKKHSILKKVNYENFGELWEITLPFGEKESFGCLSHLSKVKVSVKSRIGEVDRLPAFSTYTYQEPQSAEFKSVLWFPEKKKKIKNLNNLSSIKNNLLIYEAHVGMAQEKEGVGTFREFADNNIKIIKEAGYNTIELMAVLEHPFYGSYGYHVSNFFSVSSRFGSPDDFKYLVNKAHQAGLAVIIDLVHSHAVKNIHEGLNLFDGTQYQYFHEGGKGEHNLWDSMLFNYGKEEVSRFLLSNIRYWLEEFSLDGFRFDGITSMLYKHHGLNQSFTHYDMYFSDDVEEDTLLYLQKANHLIHYMNNDFISIAEDMSGMPGLCRPQQEGGLGFDFRLAMGAPDLWVKLIKDIPEEDWSLNEIYHTLSSRRPGEKTISYVESHDQALVGDQTLIFRTIGADMYFHMSKSSRNLNVDRGLALIKIIRIITILLGGEAYLNFMGNEFGHPDWIDFPREGNEYSYKYAQRMWHLKEDNSLLYSAIAEYDKDLLSFVSSNKVTSVHKELISIDEENKIISFAWDSFLAVVSFNSNRAFTDYRVGVKEVGKYMPVFSSDCEKYGGFNRQSPGDEHFSENVSFHNQANSIQLYVLPRTAVVYKKS